MAEDYRRRPKQQPLVGGSNKPIIIEDLPNRLVEFYQHWECDNPYFWRGSAIIVQTPPIYTTMRSLPSSILSVWLFGLEFPDTVFIFTRTHIYCLSSYFHGRLFDVLRRATITSSRQLILETHEMNSTADGIAHMDIIFGKICQFDRTNIIHIGESPPVSVYDMWLQERTRSHVRSIDITNGLAKLFSVKNEYELDNIEKSAYLNYSVMDEGLVKTLREIVNEKWNATHWKLAEEMMKYIVNPAVIGVKFKEELINICHPPVIQSGEGDDFNFEPSVTSNHKNLIFVSKNVLTCSLSSSFSDYCSYVARTFLIRPSISQKKAYMVLLSAQKKVIKTLRSGNKLSDAYREGKNVVKKKAPHLLQYLTKSAGMGVGIGFNESNLSLDEENNIIVKSGMAFKVILGLQHVEDPSGKKFSMLLGDTVIVKHVSPINVTLSLKDIEYVTYPFIQNESPQPDIKGGNTIP